MKLVISRITLFLGKISFALYLIHQYLSIGVIIPLLVNKLHLNFWVASLCIALPVVILMATFITFYIEIPLSRKMKEFLQSRLIYK